MSKQRRERRRDQDPEPQDPDEVEPAWPDDDRKYSGLLEEED